jgi:hypothetical protein
MTPEQAAHHPSRNVISRALGAEAGVDVDMKTIEVEDGTAFLLCSDGITRHVPDNEIRELLAGTQDVQEVCAEMKRRCYERGAEDNLTAVIVRVGRNALADTIPMDGERTIEAARLAMAKTVDIAGNPPPADVAAQTDQKPAAQPTPSASPAPAVSEADAPKPNPILALNAQNKSRPGKGGGRAFLLLLLFIGIGAGAFYGGMYFQRRQAEGSAQANTTATPAPTATPADPTTEFEKRRHRVDSDPLKARDEMRAEAASKGMQNPLDASDPQFLYLYGRSLLLTDDYANALIAFERASAAVTDTATPLLAKLRVESRLAIGAAALKLRIKDPGAEQRAVRALDELINKAAAPTPSVPR